MKKGRTTGVNAGVHADGPVVRPYLGVALTAMMLAAWGCSPAPLERASNSQRISERRSESEVSREVGEVSEGSEKGAEPGAGGEAGDVRAVQSANAVFKVKAETPSADVVHDRGNQLQLLADEDLRAAFAAAYREPAGPVREEMLGRFALTFAKAMPTEAAAIVDKDMVAGSERDEAVIAVVHQWALNDLVGAQTWAKTFPEGPLKARALREIAGVTDYVEATLNQRTDG